MPQLPHDDLFDESKMTFGEHLDELRGALLKAFLALAVGFVIGLWFAGDVVKFLQVPIVAALEEYYEREVAEHVLEMVRKQVAQGKTPPKALEKMEEMTDQELEAAAIALLDEGGMIPETVYVRPEQLLKAFQQEYPEWIGELPPASESDTGAFRREEMIAFDIWRPLEHDPRMKLKTLNAQEGFMVYIKAALMFGLMVASFPIFYFLWSFVASGLYPHERRYVHIFGPFSLVLFLAGSALAFFAVFRFVLGFLFLFNEMMGIDPDPRINEWLGFALMLPLGFGISFQLPLVMLFLERIGVFSIAVYLSKWRIAVLTIFVLSMLLTPADPTSMILMAVPLTGLYFFGILLCRFMPRRKSPLAG